MGSPGREVGAFSHLARGRSLAEMVASTGVSQFFTDGSRAARGAAGRTVRGSHFRRAERE